MSTYTVTAGVPIGSYKAKFLCDELIDHKEYGPGVKWTFEIHEGKYAGWEVSRITSPNLTLKNAAGKIIRGLVGHILENGVDVNIDDCVDRLYSIVMDETQSGGTRVESLVLCNEGDG